MQPLWEKLGLSESWYQDQRWDWRHKQAWRAWKSNEKRRADDRELAAQNGYDYDDHEQRRAFVAWKKARKSGTIPAEEDYDEDDEEFKKDEQSSSCLAQALMLDSVFHPSESFVVAHGVHSEKIARCNVVVWLVG